MTIVVNLATPSPAGASGPVLIPKTAEGFPRFGLASLHLLKETGLSDGLKNELNGVVSGVVLGNAPTVAMGAQGGMTVTPGASATAHVPVASLNITQPWTVAMVATRPSPPSIANSRLCPLAFGDIDSRGMYANLQALAGDTITTDGYHNINTFRKTAGGVAQDSLLKPWTAQYGRSATYIWRHDGAGAVTIDIYRGGKSNRIASTWDLSGLQGSPAQTVMQVKFGSCHLSYTDGSIIHDAWATYTRRIADDECLAFASAGVVLAATRGRS